MKSIVSEKSSANSSAFAKLAGSKDLPRFSKEINGQVQENFRDIASVWMQIVINIREGRDHNHNVVVAPANPGARPILIIPPGASATAARDIRDDYKIDLGTWSYEMELYERYRNQSMGLFGFIMNHLETLPANRVRRHTLFEEAEKQYDFGLLWVIILDCHQMTGAAKVAENLRIQNNLLNIRMNKDESLDDYCNRFDELLTQAILSGLINDGPQTATAFMKGLVHTSYKSLAIECLSAGKPLQHSVQAMERARNYQALIEIEYNDEETFAASVSSRNIRNEKKGRAFKSQKDSRKVLTEEEKFEIGRRRFLEKKKNNQALQRKKNVDKIKCYSCNKYGHFASDCNNKRKFTKNESASNANDNQSSSDSSSDEETDDEINHSSRQ